MIRNTALIARGNGIVGRNLTQYLTNTGVWDVIVTSRSLLSYTTTAQYVSLDLNDVGVVESEREKLKMLRMSFLQLILKNIPLMNNRTQTSHC